MLVIIKAGFLVTGSSVILLVVSHLSPTAAIRGVARAAAPCPLYLCYWLPYLYTYIARSVDSWRKVPRKSFETYLLRLLGF